MSEQETIFSPFLLPEETAAYLRIPMNSLYKLTSQRQIPFYKVNKKNLRFDKRELDKWLKEKRRMPIINNT